MSNKKLKTRINYLIDTVEDEKVLKEIYDLLKSKLNVANDPQVNYIPVSKVVPKSNSSKKTKTKTEVREDYTKPGKPMSIAEFNKRINDALARVDAGQYTTQEDLEKEMKKW